MKPKRKAVTVRLTATAVAMLDDLARTLGVSRTSVVEMVVRAEARRLGVAGGPRREESGNGQS